MVVHRSAKTTVTLLTVSVIVLILLFLLWLWIKHIARQEFARLLSGDETIAIQALEIELGSKRGEVVLQDREVLDYLSSMFRSSRSEGAEAGATYYMHVRLSSGSLVLCSLLVPEKTDRITICFPLDTFDDDTWYDVTLRDPIPKKLQEILDALR